MKRRTYAVLGFSTLGLLAGLASIRPLADGGGIDPSYGFVAAAFGFLAGYYQVHSTPFENPNEPVPEWWFKLTAIGVAVVAAVGGGVLLVLAII